MPACLDHPRVPWALKNVPAFPSVAQRILRLVSASETSPVEIGETVKLDPSFSAELLRFANSALFGSRDVRSLTQAILMLGTERVKTMALLVVMNRAVRPALRIHELRTIWLHSLATALIAEEIGPRMDVNRDSAYTAGLLHNLGMLGLMSAFPDEYARMLSISSEFGFDLLTTERDLFEIDHCAAGAFLAHDWHFPEELSDAIRVHHDGPFLGRNGLDALLQVSWRMADALGYVVFAPEHTWRYEELLERIPQDSNSWLADSAEDALCELGTRLAAAPV